jgi:hypothetical protein
MSKPEGHADHLVSPVAQEAVGHEETMAYLPDDAPAILELTRKDGD